jgi:dTDP-4-dehydrorhamnose reductase
MKIIVIGSRGMLGTDLMQVLAPRNPLGLDLPEMDITDSRRCLRRIEELNPAVIVNAAAMTDVDYCESHEKEALKVNGEGAGNLAAAAQATGARMVHFSTDYIFDGACKGGYREEDSPGPLSAYGRSKLRGEELVRSLCREHLIVRTSWLFGCHGKNFIRTILNAAGSGQPLRVVDDQCGSPTYSRDLAQRTVTLLDAECRGVYHVTNSGTCSWYELALHSFECAAKEVPAIQAVPTREFPRPAPRPAYSILANARMQREGFPELRPWQEAVCEYIVTCLSAP